MTWMEVLSPANAAALLQQADQLPRRRLAIKSVTPAAVAVPLGKP
jgi:hypothetical protein